MYRSFGKLSVSLHRHFQERVNITSYVAVSMQIGLLGLRVLNPFYETLELLCGL